MFDTVLVVDDDAINRKVLEAIFESRYAVTSVGSTLEALELLRKDPSPYCAILLDVVMEDMSGLQFLEIFNDMGFRDRIPVFLVTSQGDVQTARHAYELGVADVINKPVIDFVVERRVANVVELFLQRRLLDQRVAEQTKENIAQPLSFRELNRGLIETFSAVIEFRDGESGKHVRRIYELTKFFLTRTEFGAGMDEETIELVALASIMHDVGKIGISDAILMKPGRYTPEEYATMKQHTVIGAEMLASIEQIRSLPIYAYAHDIVLHHHERWDGRGYPEGLKGDEISVPAQIVGMVDCYDALVTKRRYKEKLPHRTALQMIRDGKCGAFNPKLLDCLERHADEIHAKLYPDDEC